MGIRFNVEALVSTAYPNAGADTSAIYTPQSSIAYRFILL